MAETNVIDFGGKDFEETQKLLSATGKIEKLRNEVSKVHDQKETILTSAMGSGDQDEVIQRHLDKFATMEELEHYLKGNVTHDHVAERINEFFTNEETGEVLTLITDEENKKTEEEELEFKRGLLLYFKQNDFYLEKIDEEIASLNETTQALSDDLSNALNPLKDNVLAYAQYLIDNSDIDDENDDSVTMKKKREMLKKGIAIRSGYTFEMLFSLIDKHPNILNNAFKDSKNDNAIRSIGKRYADKLKRFDISFNLFNLLSDEPHESLEYLTIPKGDYPEGLENLTVFFIIRAMALGMDTPMDVTFHASVYIALSRLKDGTLDADVAATVKHSIIKLLKMFDNL